MMQCIQSQQGPGLGQQGGKPGGKVGNKDAHNPESRTGHQQGIQELQLLKLNGWR
jgi:hypothetical protein